MWYVKKQQPKIIIIYVLVKVGHSYPALCVFVCVYKGGWVLDFEW